MNRNRLCFYGTASMKDGSSSAASRRLSLPGTALQQMFQDDPAVSMSDSFVVEAAEEEEKHNHDVLPEIKLARRRRRFSFMSENSSKKENCSTADEKEKNQLMADTSSTTMGTKETSTTVTSATAPSRARSSSPASAIGNRARRRSSRKSVNGLVIEFDLDDESECTMFAECDDYEEDLRPPLKREDSNESLEELRTRLEALEHERNSQQLPEHDEIGLGFECVNKKLMEALESSSRHNHKDATSANDLRGIPEHQQDDEDEEADAASVPSSGGDGFHQAQHRRSTVRSSVRSSIHGLVLEYDCSCSEDEEEEDDDRANHDGGVEC